ncbi:MAG: hypothetical protein ABI140_02455 [Jatrophihabitantaceae bacterium]
MQIFLAQRLCVSVEDVDFLNPNRLQDGRECGVRLELRLAEADTLPASIYASRGLSVSRGLCRFDLLESAPGAQDRMHWHPEMPNGEGRKRLYDDELSAHPLAWLHSMLTDGLGLLATAGIPDVERFAADAKVLARLSDAIVADTGTRLNRMRSVIWPVVERRDERGMAVLD